MIIVPLFEAIKPKTRANAIRKSRKLEAKNKLDGKQDQVYPQSVGMNNFSYTNMNSESIRNSSKRQSEEQRHRFNSIFITPGSQNIMFNHTAHNTPKTPTSNAATRIVASNYEFVFVGQED